MTNKRFPLVFFCLLSLVILLCSCVARPKPFESSRRRQYLDSITEARYSRDNPSYIQQLVSTSLLTQSENADLRLGAHTLPGIRRYSAADFLNDQSVWLKINPMQAAWQGDALFFDALTSSGYALALARLGIDGVLFCGVSESGSTWNASARTFQSGSDLISMEIAERYGDEAAYAAFRSSVNNLLFGGELLPAATGLGPDFSMALRGYAEYAPLYQATPVPPELWPLLPLRRYSDGAMGRILTEETLSQLQAAGLPGLLGAPYAQDFERSDAGWAITSEIVGQDGEIRRWLYRYFGNVERPVLDLDHPAGLAKQVLSGNIAWQTNIMGHNLICLNTDAWRGLAKPGQPDPSLLALADLAMQIHAQGGLVLLQDSLPQAQLPQVQAAGADFVRDTVLSPALEYALLTKDTNPLKQAIDQSLATGLDQRGLWRASPDGDGLDFGPANLSAEQTLSQLLLNENIQPEWFTYLKAENNQLFVNSAGLAAVVSGYTPRQALLVEPDAVATIQAAHLLQIAFRAFMPGLLVLSPRDLEGTMFALNQEPHQPSQTAWSLDGNRLNTTWSGMTADVGVYAPITWQVGKTNTFAANLSQILAIREQSKVAAGELTARANITNQSAVGVITRLPDGDYLLTAGNFSGRSFVTTVSFRPGLVPPGTTAVDLITDKQMLMDDNSVRLRFEPWQFRVIRMRAYR